MESSLLSSYLSIAGWSVSEDDLEKVAHYSGALACREDFLERNVWEEYEHWLPNADDVKPDN